MVSTDKRSNLVLIQKRFFFDQAQESELRIITKSGEVRGLRDQGHAVWGESEGRVMRIYGAGPDIPERRWLKELA